MIQNYALGALASVNKSELADTAGVTRETHWKSHRRLVAPCTSCLCEFRVKCLVMGLWLLMVSKNRN